jgi:hypothetical protein
MRFDFCGEQFTVSVIDNLIRDGILCDGYFEPGARRVLISTVATDRKRTLFHELRHAWIFALGQRGIDPESDAVDVAAFADIVSDQLGRQGGEHALSMLRPPRQEQVEVAAKFVVSDRMDCSCGTQVMIGSIHTGDPEYVTLIGQHVVNRWMDCDACGSVTVWREVAAEDGTPLGRFLPTPRVLRGSQRAAWLRDQKTLAVH